MIQEVIHVIMIIDQVIKVITTIDIDLHIIIMGAGLPLILLLLQDIHLLNLDHHHQDLYQDGIIEVLV
jgi:hypothetical protein